VQSKYLCNLNNLCNHNIKTMKTRPILIILALLSFGLTACKKDKTDNRKTYLTIHRHGSGTIEYTYDDKDRLTDETIKDARGETDLHLAYRQFNAVGMPQRVDYIFPEAVHQPYILVEYDGSARPVKIIQYATDGTAGPYETFTYVTGRVEYRTFSSGGAQQSSKIYAINNAGNVLSADFFGDDGLLSWRIVYTGYDNKKAPTHPYKYLAIALDEVPNFFSANNYTGYEAYAGTTLDAKYSCTYTYNQQGFASGRVTTDLVSNVSSEEFYEFVER